MAGKYPFEKLRQSMSPEVAEAFEAGRRYAAEERANYWETLTENERDGYRQYELARTLFEAENSWRAGEQEPQLDERHFKVAISYYLFLARYIMAIHEFADDEDHDSPA